MNKVDYDKATYSLAIIDIDLFIESLHNTDEVIKDTKETMDLIFSSNKKNLVPCLQEHSLAKLMEIRNYIKKIRGRVEKYRKILKIYLSKNLIAQETFNLKVNEMEELIKQRQSSLNLYILQCQNYIDKHSTKQKFKL